MDEREYSVKIGGHITLIFEIDTSSENLDQQGSRGAGICIDKGVNITTIAKKGNGAVIIDSEEKNISKKLYELIIQEISKNFQKVQEYNWYFNIKSDLPFGQGFGCSASGALATVISILKILKEDENIYQNSISIAHRVERLLSSGLGDVTGISAGGVELRTNPGLPFPPNNGLILSWYEDIPILVCWIKNEEKHTAEYINSKKWINQINSAGKECLNILNKKIWNKDIWSDLLIQSKRFGEISGMMENINRKNLILKLENLLVQKNLNSSWDVRLCMLGTSAIILPKNITHYDKDDLSEILKELINLNLRGCITNIIERPIKFN